MDGEILSPTPPAIRPRFIMVLLAIVGALAGAWYLREQAQEKRRAEEQRSSFETATRPVTRVQVWAAGSRTSSGFCSPCSPHPPAVVFETTDPGEIDSLRSAFRFSGETPHDLVKHCGSMTVEFYKDQDLLLSANVRGAMIVSRPITASLTPDGENALSAWLARHDIPNKVTLAWTYRPDNTKK